MRRVRNSGSRTINVQRYDVLDGMRGVAAICVMLMHFLSHENIHIFPNADVAVDFFFILSGFVLAHAYGNASALSTYSFMRIRIIRLYPMFLLGMCIAAPVLFMNGKSWGTTYRPDEVISATICNILYLPFFGGYLPATVGNPIDTVPVFPLNPPAWSLFFEMLVNLFFLRFIGLGKYKLATIVAASFVMMIAVGLAAIYILENRLGIQVQSGWGASNIAGGIPRVFFGFTFGILIYRIVNDDRFSRIKALAKNKPWLSYLTLSLMVLIISIPAPKGWVSVVYLALIASAAPLLVIAGSLIHCEGTVERRVMKTLGWLSYPVYCLHMPIAHHVELWYERGLQIPVAAVISSTILTLALSIVLTRFYEEPVRFWLSRNAQKN